MNHWMNLQNECWIIQLSFFFCSCISKLYIPCFSSQKRQNKQNQKCALIAKGFWNLTYLFYFFIFANPLSSMVCLFPAKMPPKHAKPEFSESQVSEILQRLYKLTSSEIRSLPSYDDQNFYVAAVEGGEYVFKIMNSEDSKNPAITEVQTYAMSFLCQNGLPAQTVLPTVSGQQISLEEMGMRKSRTHEKRGNWKINGLHFKYAF